MDERDQTADRAVVLEDLDTKGHLWLALIEAQAQHDPQKLDDLLSEVGQFRRNLRHGPDRAGKYVVLPVFIYLRGECPADETVLDMTVPTGYGVRHAPLIWTVGKDGAADALDAFEKDRTMWGILFWVSLMLGAESESIVSRWRDLVKALPDARQRANLRGIAFVFAGLAGRGQEWRKILEGGEMTESPIVNEWIAEATAETRLSTRREDLLNVLHERFPNAVPADVVETIKAQPSSELLADWVRQAVRARTIEDFRDHLRQ